VFTVDSQDQGWSDFRDDHGAERNSWTWFEAVVRDPTRDVYQDTLRQHFETVALRNGVLGEIPPPPRGKEIVRNMHALRKFQLKSKAWSVLDEDEETRRWVRELKRGQVIDLNVWARFVGWRNRVRGASIDVYTTAVR
jgi:hypothetical protein